MPSIEQLKSAASAINAQHPATSGDGREADGLLVLRLRAEHIQTIASALGLASGVALDDGARRATPVQKGWAAIIDGGLIARGSTGLAGEALRALERVDPPTLERMAALGPDTPDSVAEKARAGRKALCNLKEVLP